MGIVIWIFKSRFCQMCILLTLGLLFINIIFKYLSDKYVVCLCVSMRDYIKNFSQHVLLGTLVLGLSLKIVMIICYQGTTNVLENVKVVKKRYINSNKTCITTQAHYNNKEFTYQVYVTVMIYDYNNHTLLSNDETYICNLTYYQDYG